MTPIAQPEVLIEKIKQEFEKSVKVTEVPISLSIGYAVFDSAMDRNIADTQRRADQLMYQEKERIYRENEKRI